MMGPRGWAGGMGMLGQRKLPVNSSHLGTWGERGLLGCEIFLRHKIEKGLNPLGHLSQ